MSKRCSCGNERFTAYMSPTYEVILGADGEWERDLGFVHQGEHHGPYICTACGEEYDEWWFVPDAPDEFGEDEEDEK